jgi:GNAT superfamily N-acetyltransferase
VTTPFSGVRRATLADVASIARLSVCANREVWRDVPALQDAIEPSAPEIALQLLEDLDDGHELYVAERQARNIGFAHLTRPTTGDGGDVVELRDLYISSEYRHSGLGRQLLRFVLRELRQRPNRPVLRVWAATGSAAAGFVEAAGGQAVRERWKVGQGMYAVRGTIFDWRPGGHCNSVAARQQRAAIRPRVGVLGGAARARA